MVASLQTQLIDDDQANKEDEDTEALESNDKED